MKLDQKYMALIQEAERRGIADIESMRICFEVLSLASTIDRECASLLAPHMLSEGRFVILSLLAGSVDGMAPNELADKAGVTRATISGLLDGLERDELIKRKVDRTDRRALVIVLTSKGKEIAGQVVDQHSRWIAGLFGSLSTLERAQLTKLLDKVTERSDL
ncbi:MarR family winged helix-turn-helix transcriptional regulator [Brachymonas sp. M4Q-1]|uniref:MarR family winged helix-turn-helix transcriptional regulator n=1 Tax=Brachymonas sp. M4Q-1 TaxID=3416906 RepID=UPI003CFA0B5B